MGITPLKKGNTVVGKRVTLHPISDEQDLPFRPGKAISAFTALPWQEVPGIGKFVANPGPSASFDS